MAKPELVCKKMSDGEYECTLENIEGSTFILPETSNFGISGEMGRCYDLRGQHPDIAECKNLLNGVIHFY